MFDEINPYHSSSLPAEHGLPPLRLLDELAAAFHIVRGRPKPRRVVNSLDLRAQFPGDFSPRDWQRLESELGCSLPPLVPCEDGHALEFPNNWQTLHDLVMHVAWHRTDWDLPGELTLPTWRDAQIFAGVRDCFVTTTGVAKHAIVREALISEDLGLD
jgi:hypothetical protein